MEEEFLQYLKNEKRYSVHTLTAYGNDLQHFRAFIREQGVDDLSSVTSDLVRTYIVKLMDQQFDSSSVGRKLSALRSLYKFGIRRGLLSKEPLSVIRAPKLHKKLPVFIEERQIVGLLESEVFFKDDFEGVRDQLIIELLFGTGIRLSELVGLTLSDLDHHNHTIKVLGKRNKERIIPVPRSIYQIIDTFSKLRALAKLAHTSDRVIVTASGKAVYPGLIYRVVNKYLTYISTQDKRSPHVLRHSYATALLNKGADLNAIKTLLGHESLAATQVYVHNSIERLKSVYKQAHPKA